MIRTLTLGFLLMLLLFATGCPKYRPEVDFNKEGLAKTVNDHFTKKQQEYFAVLASDPGKAKVIRNELIEDALPYVDDAYIDFITGLQQGRDRGNFLADVVELGTTAAVGITKGERPLQILGVALTAFRGGRRSADLNFYREQATPVLINKMDGNRAKVRAAILNREKEEVSTYQIGSAIGDIVEYYNAGTLVRAFTELQKDTSADTKQAEKDLKDLKKELGIRPAPSEAEIKLSRDNADAIDALVKAYVDADDQVTAADAKVTTAQSAIAAASQAKEAAATRITQATQKIAAAATDVARTQAQTEKTNAEADQAKADADKTKAEGEKAQAETAKTEATKARDTALANLRGAYSSIEGDPSLGPLLMAIPDSDPGYSAEFKATLRAQLKRVKENKVSPPSDRPTAEDYASILLKVGKVVRERFSTDPTLNDRLQKILKINK